MEKEKIIMGVDPGTNILGYAILSIKGKALSCLVFDVLNLSKVESHEEKIKQIFITINGLIQIYKPVEFIVEAPFYGKNVQSMLKLGRAQGVSIAAAIANNIPFYEYEPKKIKQSITGSGSASKEQVAIMVKSILGIKDDHKYLDATDALAVALCHHFKGNVLLKDSIKASKAKPKKYGSWETFVSNNPSKIKNPD